jgi:hypothetical protein
MLMRATIVVIIVSAALLCAPLGSTAEGLIRASSAGACRSWKVQATKNPGGSTSFNELSGVAATSATDVWAVGDYIKGFVHHTLVERWNGKAWKVQRVPNPGGSADSNALVGVAATSPTNVWAVGDSYNGTVFRPLVEHWNGKAWKVQPSPNPGGSADSNGLLSVAATSATNAWAVGFHDTSSSYQTLVEHWNGKIWKVQRSANPGSYANVLEGVAATSPTNAWAVGGFGTAIGEGENLAEHWNGTAWQSKTAPNLGNPNSLRGVAATSPTNAWAVGTASFGTNESQTLIEQWDGSFWNFQKSPNPGGATGQNALTGVAATSSTNAWAVGDYGAFTKTLVEHWNGTAWKVQPSANPTPYNTLSAVAATSATNAWAVGTSSKGSAVQTLALHCR